MFFEVAIAQPRIVKPSLCVMMVAMGATLPDLTTRRILTQDILMIMN